MSILIRQAASACVWACLAISVSSCASSSEDAEVKAARELIDTWSGQPTLLNQAAQKLIGVLAEDPQNYRALKEYARLQLKAGYINNSRSGRYKANNYIVGNFRPGTLEQAETTIRRAIQINPHFADGYVLLGHIQYEQTKLDEAANTLAQAERMGSRDPWLYMNWAMVLDAEGEHAAAEEKCRQVLESNAASTKTKVSAYDVLVDEAKKDGANDRVVALYREEIRLEPNNAWIHGNLAESLGSIDRNDGAITEARAALSIMDYPVGEQILAGALYRRWADMVEQGNGAAGDQYFQEAMGIYPQLNEVMAYGASMPGGERLAKALMARKGISIDAPAEDGSTALLIAVNRDRVQVVKTLLALNADPNTHDNGGWTPLLSAADNGNAEIVSLLLAKGANVHATLQGLNAAAFAERRGDMALATLLRKKAGDAM